MPIPSSGTLNHPTLGPVLYTTTELSDNPDDQVAQTIALMSRYACEDSGSPLMAGRLAEAHQSDDPIADTWAYLARFGGKSGMVFVRDELTGEPFEDSPARVGGWRPLVEALIRPADQCVLAQPQGDCDDFSMLGAAHLLSRDVACSFATVAVDSPDLYSHVYLVAYPTSGPYAGQRVPMDLSHGPNVGWEVPNNFGKFQEWPVRQGGGVVLIGLLLGAAYLLYQVFKRGVFQ